MPSRTGVGSCVGGYGARGRGTTATGCISQSDADMRRDRTYEEACWLCDTRKRPYKLCNDHWKDSTQKEDKIKVVKRFK